MRVNERDGMRNLEQIEESSTISRASNAFSSLGLLLLSGTCIALAIFAFTSRTGKNNLKSTKVDPLSELATKSVPSLISPSEVTFPHLLSDRQQPATAFAVAAGPSSSVSALGTVFPPPAMDKLSVVPLPARHALSPLPALQKAHDKLTALASDAVNPTPTGGKLAPIGREGGWQVQVSSHRTQGEADAFVAQLRARGHRAHVEQTEIPKRGTWYRVRVGPYTSQAEALRARTLMESRESLQGYVIRSRDELMRTAARRNENHR